MMGEAKRNGSAARRTKAVQHCRHRHPDTDEPCYQLAGHDGMHSWQYCQEEWLGDGPQCEKPRRHEGEHHAEVSW